MTGIDSKAYRAPEAGVEVAVRANACRPVQRLGAVLTSLLVGVCWVLTLGHMYGLPNCDPVYLRASNTEGWLTSRPLIGVVSQSLGPDAFGSQSRDPDLRKSGNSYIAASYIKFIESAGARAVPILQDMPQEEIRRRFKAVNGILIPGGSQILSAGHPYYDTTKLLLDMTIKENDNGVSFPLHGTCLGFEALAVAVTGNASILQDFDAIDYPQPLIPVLDAGTSEFFGAMPLALRKALFTKSYAYENHVHGITYGDFIDNPRLAEFFDMLTMSVDRRGTHYVSTMEAKRYPVSATQWHPEKNAFEWSPKLNIPHDPVAVLVTQVVADTFVNKARKNAHAPASREEESELLIYNWSKRLEFTGGSGGVFDQVYVFPPWEEISKGADSNQIDSNRADGVASR